jgi:hypothetical protein
VRAVKYFDRLSADTYLICIDPAVRYFTGSEDRTSGSVLTSSVAASAKPLRCKAAFDPAAAGRDRLVPGGLAPAQNRAATL